MVTGADGATSIVLVADSGVVGGAGGTQHLVSRLSSAASDAGLDEEVVPLDGALAAVLKFGGSPIVFVQPSGDLSRAYAHAMSALLEAGAHVIEKNVFALSSRWRPRDKNYHMAVMSQDGAIRYGLRARILREPLQQRVHILPNPSLVEVSTSTASSPPTDFLRIGRPDPIKWTDFELRFCEQWALTTKSEITLRRVGYPGPSGARRFGNLTVVDSPYSSDASKLYADSDCYLHHSRIGETYGNTIFEAAAAGLPVVAGFSLGWDSASIEYLGKGHITGTPRGLLRNVDQVRRALESAGPMAPILRANTPETYIENLLRISRSSDVHASDPPRVGDIVRYFNRLGRTLTFPAPLAGQAALGRELVRSARDSFKGRGR